LITRRPAIHGVDLADAELHGFGDSRDEDMLRHWCKFKPAGWHRDLGDCRATYQRLSQHEADAADEDRQEECSGPAAGRIHEVHDGSNHS
jgi:hypothetical protein